MFGFLFLSIALPNSLHLSPEAILIDQRMTAIPTSHRMLRSYPPSSKMKALNHMSTAFRTEAQISELGSVIRSGMRQLSSPALSYRKTSRAIFGPSICSCYSVIDKMRELGSLEVEEAIAFTTGTLFRTQVLVPSYFVACLLSCTARLPPRCRSKVSLINDVLPMPGSLSPKNGVCSTMFRISNPPFTGHVLKRRCHLLGILYGATSDHRTLRLSVNVVSKQ